METIATLTARFAQSGSVTWIGLRPARRADLQPVETAWIAEAGLDGDHRATPGKRAVTLIQAEHLPVIAALAGRESLTPALLRRNIAVSGINLLGMRNRAFRIGEAVLEVSGLCAPCSRMEALLGPGGYTAMRGHGGITASVIAPGQIALSDTVVPV
ncbi:MAG: MOSC domain-containing protein [Pseudomonadota bacterium]